MIYESTRYYRYDGTFGRCTLTGEVCSSNSVKHDCRSCLVPVYIWMLENEARE